MSNMYIDLPDGWTCIGCGDEYPEDTQGQSVGDYTEGTLCRKCKMEEWDNGKYRIKLEKP